MSKMLSEVKIGDVIYVASTDRWGTFELPPGYYRIREFFDLKTETTQLPVNRFVHLEALDKSPFPRLAGRHLGLLNFRVVSEEEAQVAEVLNA